VLPGGGLYYGPVSIAYLFFVLQPLYPELQVESRGLGEWSAAYLSRAQKDMMSYPGPERNKCGVSDDIMAMLVLDAISTRDAELVHELCDFADVVTEPGAENEWLYGRAGYLYLLRLVRACFAKNDEVKVLVNETADEIIDEIMESPRPWKWHGKPYGAFPHHSDVV
jgi:Lanthionine synthetase C-like protein